MTTTGWILLGIFCAMLAVLAVASFLGRNLGGERIQRGVGVDRGFWSYWWRFELVEDLLELLFGWF